MQAIQNFAFEEHLVRVVEHEGEPWFVANDVCSVLEIKNSRDAMGRLDDDEKRPDVGIADTSGTKYVTVVSEAGVYRLTFTSRKPEAERFKRWLAHDVLPQIRKTGSYADEAKGKTPHEAIAMDAPLAARIDAVRLARALFGADRARSLWLEMGLPYVPPPSPFHGIGEAAECLRVLLDYAPDGSNVTVRDMLMRAMDGDLEARALLEIMGIRYAEESEGFWISNTSRDVQQIYAGTKFAGRWTLILRRLKGAGAAGR